MQHTPEIEAFIEEHKDLFWYIAPNKKKNISEEVLVEFILNYGNEESIKKLFRLLGITKVKYILENLHPRQKGNYFPEIYNYFLHYTQRHAQGNSFKRTA